MLLRCTVQTKREREICDVDSQSVDHPTALYWPTQEDRWVKSLDNSSSNLPLLRCWETRLRSTPRRGWPPGGHGFKATCEQLPKPATTSGERMRLSQGMEDFKRHLQKHPEVCKILQIHQNLAKDVAMPRTRASNWTAPRMISTYKSYKHSFLACRW